MLGTLLHGMKGTPYVYQGEEIGMTNARFDTIDDYIDIETQSAYNARIQAGFSEKDVMQSLYMKSRDNARTPMQWSDAPSAGFTEGRPWMKVNPNYQTINVLNDLKNKNSVFYHYQQLIRLRKDNETIVYGKYNLLNPDNRHVYAYERVSNDERLLIVCNFYKTERKFSYQVPPNCKNVDILLSSYADTGNYLAHIHLRPYEAVIYKIS